MTRKMNIFWMSVPWIDNKSWIVNPLLFWLGKNYLLISISMWYEFRDGFTNRARAEKYRQLRYFIVLTWFWPSEPAVQKKHPLRFFSLSKFSLLMFWLKTFEHPASTIPRRWYKNIRFLFHTVSLAWKRSNFFISPCKLVLRIGESIEWSPFWE